MNNPNYDFYFPSGHQRRPWYEKIDKPRNETVKQWIEDRIRFQIKVIQHQAKNDGDINPHKLARETGFTIGWIKRRLKQCNFRYYLHKKRPISEKLFQKSRNFLHFSRPWRSKTVFSVDLKISWVFNEISLWVDYP